MPKRRDSGGITNTHPPSPSCFSYQGPWRSWRPIPTRYGLYICQASLTRERLTCQTTYLLFPAIFIAVLQGCACSWTQDQVRKGSWGKSWAQNLLAKLTEFLDVSQKRDKQTREGKGGRTKVNLFFFFLNSIQICLLRSA